MSIVGRWGSSDKAVGGFWGTPKFGVIPLGPEKHPSPRFLGFVTSGLSNLSKGGIFLSFKGLVSFIA